MGGRGAVIWLVVVVVAAVHGIYGVDGRRRSFGGGKEGKAQGKCKNRLFKLLREDKFSYSAVVQNGVLGTTNNVSVMTIKANVFVKNYDGCQFFLKLSDVSLTEKLGNKAAITMASTDFSKRLTANGLRFTMKNGVVKTLMPSVESQEPDVLNIQRGLLSMLQLRANKGQRLYKRTEDDVSGSCMTKYRYLSNGMVRKQKDLDNCEDHQISNSNIDGVPILQVDKDPVLKSTSVCTYKIDPTQKRGGLKSISCKEHFLVRPFSSEMGGGAYVSTTSVLKKLDSTKLKATKNMFPYDKFYESSIKYDKSKHYENPHQPSFVGKVKDLLTDMAANDYRVSTKASAEKFFELVVSLRHLKTVDIGALMATVDMNQDSISSFLLDGLAQCGTPDCVTLLFVSLQKLNKLDKLKSLMPFLAFTKDPKPQVIGFIMEMSNRQPHFQQRLFPLISTLTYKMCKNRPQKCKDTGSAYFKVLQAVEQNTLRLLGDDCRTSDKSRQAEILTALKAIGNMGGPSGALKQIHRCIRKAERTYISVAAIQSLRRMSLTKSDREMFYELLTNRNEDLEKRVELFLMLMQDPTKEDIGLAKDLVNQDEESTQLRSLIYSYIRSAASNRDPTQSRKAWLFRQFGLDHFTVDPSSLGSSKAFQYGFNMYRASASVSGMSLVHPESFVPRVVQLNTTTNVLGYSFSPLEVSARMEGMESVLPKFFGKEGVLTQSYVEKLFSIPKEKLERRKRRSAMASSEYDKLDAQVNMRGNVTPEAMISVKVFGNEIQLLTLEDLPFLKGELGERNIIKDLYQLTKGKQKTFKQNMVLLEVSHSVPTVVGLPLKVAVNVSAVVTMDVEGKIETKNLLLGPKSVAMRGSLKPSISLHASGRVGATCLGTGKVGTAFQASMVAKSEVSGMVQYEEGKEVVVEMDANQPVNDVLNVTYQLFHEIPGQREPIMGVPNRVKGSFCTDDFMNTSQTLGTNTCVETSIPLAYYNLSVPYFPLSGPANFGLRTYKTDPLLKMYRMVVKKEDDLYTMRMSTPGTNVERNYEMFMGSKVEGDWKMGFNYGKDGKGMVYNTVFDKDTNALKLNMNSTMFSVPVILEARFFNDTDSNTLARKIGGAIKIDMRSPQRYGLFSESTIFYKSSYDFWAVGGTFEYNKRNMAAFQLKVQYEPQMISFTLDFPATNTKLTAYGKPSLPVMESGLSITSGEDFSFSSRGSVDFEKYLINGFVKVQPVGHETSFKTQIFPEMKRLSVVGETNGSPFVWSAQLSRVKNVNVLNEKFQIAGQKGTSVIKWSSEMVQGSIKYGDFDANIDYKMAMSADGIKEIGNVTWGGETASYHFSYRNTTDKTVACLQGTVLKETKYGYCYDRYTSAGTKGFVFRMLDKTLGWIDQTSFLGQTLEDGSTHVQYKVGNRLHGRNRMAVKNNDVNDPENYYFNFVYKRDDENVKFNTNLKNLPNILDMESSALIGRKDGKEVKHAELKFGDEGPEGELIHMSISYKEHESDGDSRKDKYHFKLRTNEREYSSKVTFNNIDSEKFIHEFRWIDDKNAKKDSSFNVVLKDSKSPSPSQTPAIIIDYNTVGYWSGLEVLPNEEMEGMRLPPMKMSRVITDKSYTSRVETKKCPKCDYEERFAYKFDGTNKVHVVKSKDIPNVYAIYQQSYQKQHVEFLEEILPQVIGIFGVKESTTNNLIRLLHNGTIEYFTSPDCNGEDVVQKYITGRLNASLVNDFLAEVLLRPFNPIVIAMVEQYSKDNPKMQLEKLVDFLKKGGEYLDKTVFESLMAAAEDGLNSLPEVRRSRLSRLLNMVKKRLGSGKKIEDQIINYGSTFVDQFFQLITKELSTIDIEKDLAVVFNYVPQHMKGRIVEILENTLKTLQTWRYQLGETPLKNFQMFMQKLNEAGTKDLFLLDLETMLVNGIFQFISFPPEVESAIMGFMKDSNFEVLFSRMTEFALIQYGVQGVPKDHVKKLMTSSSLKDYLEKLSTIIVNDPGVSSSSKAPFKEYLKTQEIDELFNQLKKSLKDSYSVPDYVLGLLNELFSKVDTKTLSLKDIPALIVTDKIPVVLKKLIETAQQMDLFVIGLNMIKISVPGVGPRFEEFLALMESDKDLSQVAGSMYKLVIKSLKEFGNLNLDTKVVDKYLDMLLSGSTLAKLKEMLLQRYDMISLNNTSLPSSVLRDLQVLKAKVRVHLVNLDVEVMKQNTSSELVKLFEGLVGVLMDFSDERLREGIKGVIAQLPKLVMTKFLKNGDYFKEYEEYLDQFNSIVRMVTDLLDRSLRENNNKFSIVAILRNIGKVLGSSDAVQAAISNLDMSKLNNLTYDVFVNDLMEFMDAVGKIKYGNKIINEHLQSFITDLKLQMKEAYGWVNQQFLVFKSSQEQGKVIFRWFFNKLRNYIRIAQSSDNKLLNFAVDVLVPGIDGLFVMEELQQREEEKRRNADMRQFNVSIPEATMEQAFRFSNDPCLAGFIGSWGEPPVFQSGKYIYSKPMKKKLLEYRKSSSCKMLKLKETVKKMKKDRNFFINLLSHLESILVQGCDENMKVAEDLNKMLKSAMVGDTLFSSYNAEDVSLGAVIAKVADNAVVLMNKTVLLDRLMYQMVRRFEGGAAGRVLFDHYLLRHLRSLPQLMEVPIQQIDEFGNDYIIPAYLETKNKFHNISTIIKSVTKFIVERFTKFTNPETGGVLQLLPESVAEQLKKKANQLKKSIIATMYRFERAIRGSLSRVEDSFNKYRVQIRARLADLQRMITKAIKKNLDAMMKALTRFEQKIRKLAEPLNNKEWQGASIKGKFAMLTKKTLETKKKYKNMKLKFLSQVYKKILKRLKGISWMHADIRKLFKDLNFQVLNMMVQTLHMQPKQILRTGLDFTTPQFFKLLRLLDQKICLLKKMIRKVVTYNAKDGYFSINLAILEPLQQIPWFFIMSTYNDAASLKMVNQMNVGAWDGLKSKVIRKTLQSTMEKSLRIYFHTIETSLKTEAEFLYNMNRMQAALADQSPDVMIKGLISQYRSELRSIRKTLMEAMSIDPPSDIETPIIRFMGMNKKPQRKLFTPLSRTAYLFKRSLVTYDGQALLLPSNLLTKTYNCKFLLTRDFMRKMFTVYLSQGSVNVQLPDCKIVIPMVKTKVQVYPLTQQGISPKPVRDFPLGLHSTVVKRVSRDVVHISSKVGLELFCNVNSFACNITVPGYYHNKTLGLLGTNNAESSDDFRMPTGELASGAPEFLRSFELSKGKECSIDTGSLASRTPSLVQECNHPRFEWIYGFRRSLAFRRVCASQNNSCQVHQSYLNSLLKENGYESVRPPPSCGCSDRTERVNLKSTVPANIDGKPTVHISLLIKLVPGLKTVVPRIQACLEHLNSAVKDFVDLQFNVIGFNGQDVFREAHIHTSDGEVTYGLKAVDSVLSRLKFTGKDSGEKLGLSALQLAAPLQSERGSLIVLLFDNDATYGNLLQQMTDVSTTLYEYGVILNVVNNYSKMTRNNVIAKDSSGSTYNVFKPKGEQFKSVSFPPTDDYIPYVKQTGGAAIALEAFTTDDAAWSKALPISLTEILRKQIDADLKQCKECACAACKNIDQEDCEMDGPYRRDA